MSDRLKITAISDKDRELVYQAAQLVLGRYSGGLYKWNIADGDDLWKIHFGVRAGVLGVNLSGQRCCVKLFYDNRVYIKLRNLLGLPKARRAFLKGLELKRRKVLCPEMLGWAVDCKTGLALLVTGLISDYTQVDKYIEQGHLSGEFIHSLAAFVRNMHDAGVAHNDLSLRNIMVKKCDGQYCFQLLDYEDAVFSSQTPRQQRLMNLHHLNERALAITKLKDRLLFLKYYIKDNSRIRGWANDLRDYMMRNPSKYSQQYLKEDYV